MSKQTCPMLSLHFNRLVLTGHMRTIDAGMGSDSLAHPSAARRTTESLLLRIGHSKVGRMSIRWCPKVDRIHVYSLFASTRDCKSSGIRSTRIDTPEQPTRLVELVTVLLRQKRAIEKVFLRVQEFSVQLGYGIYIRLFYCSLTEKSNRSRLSISLLPHKRSFVGYSCYSLLR